MRTIKILLFVVATVVGIVVIRQTTSKPAATPEAGQANNERIVPPERAEHPTLSPAADAPISAPPVTEQVGNAADNAPPATKPGEQPKVASTPVQARKPKEPLRDPVARVAMSFVGMDPEAEAYWLGAIFDSSLPENEREDLMEDLNEEGLSDHRHPGPQDLPLILNRLAIIEEVLPHADEFMVTHLGEAYKDLVNLAEITQGGGEPVR